MILAERIRSLTGRMQSLAKINDHLLKIRNVRLDSKSNDRIFQQIVYLQSRPFTFRKIIANFLLKDRILSVRRSYAFIHRSFAFHNMTVYFQFKDRILCVFFSRDPILRIWKVTLLIYRFGSGVIWRHIILLMEDWWKSMVY